MSERPASLNDQHASWNSIFGQTGKRLPDRTLNPLIDPHQVVLVKSFEFPPHVDVSSTQRIFLDPHDHGPKNADYQVAELIGDALTPFPSKDLQLCLNKFHSVRLDSRNRLWVNDYRNYGLRTRKIVAYDIVSAEESYRHPCLQSRFTPFAETHFR